MKGINFDKRESMVRDCKIVRFGIYEALSHTDNTIDGTKAVSSIDEFTFYKIYLQLNSVVRYRKSGIKIVDMRLSDTPLELMAHLMCKPLDFTLVYRNKDAKLNDIADEIEKTVTSVYTSVNKLRKAGYLVNTEDGFCVPNNECRDLMAKTKLHIATKGHLAFNYMFKFCVENKSSDLTKDPADDKTEHNSGGIDKED